MPSHGGAWSPRLRVFGGLGVRGLGFRVLGLLGYFFVELVVLASGHACAVHEHICSSAA